MARSPYYKIYFKGSKVRMIVQDAWVEFELVNQDFGDIQSGEQVKNENTLSISDVFASVDLFYEVESSLLKETLILEESKLVERVVQEISWGGVTPEFEEDGSILFKDESGKAKGSTFLPRVVTSPQACIPCLKDAYVTCVIRACMACWKKARTHPGKRNKPTFIPTPGCVPAPNLN
jgi:hypothetical protein